MAAAIHAPALLWASQSAIIPRGYRLVGIAASYGFVLMLVALGLARSGLGSRVASYTTALLGWLTAHAAFVLGSVFETLAVAVAVVLTTIALRRSIWLDHLMTVFALVLLLGPPLELGVAVMSRQDSGLITAAALLTELESTPDIWLLVVDGYPSTWALNRVLDDDEDRLPTLLQEEGFTVNGDALVPYPWTVGSVPSVLAGTPVAPPGTRFDSMEMAHVKELIGGESEIFRHLRAAGYQLNVIESGWHLSRCGPRVNRCARSSLYDETTETLLSRSVLGISPQTRPVPAFSRGTMRTFDELMSLVAGKDGIPQVTFAHSLAPHPPLFLTATCDYHSPGTAIGGGVLGHVEMDEAEVTRRKRLFLDQLACVDRLVMTFVDAVPDEDVVIIFGDHGTDFLGQSLLPIDEWTLGMFMERHLSLAAVRGPQCRGVPVSTVDLLPLLIECLGGEPGTPGAPVTHALANVMEDGQRPAVSEVPPAVMEALLDQAMRAAKAMDAGVSHRQ